MLCTSSIISPLLSSLSATLKPLFSYLFHVSWTHHSSHLQAVTYWCLSVTRQLMRKPWAHTSTSKLATVNPCGSSWCASCSWKSSNLRLYCLIKYDKTWLDKTEQTTQHTMVIYGPNPQTWIMNWNNVVRLSKYCNKLVSSCVVSI